MLIEKKNHPLWKQWAKRHKVKTVTAIPDAYFEAGPTYPVRCWKTEMGDEANWEAIWIDGVINGKGWQRRCLEERGYEFD